MTRDEKIKYLSNYKNILREYKDLQRRYDGIIEKNDGLKAQVITNMPLAHNPCDKICEDICEKDRLSELIQKRHDRLFETLLSVELAIHNLDESIFRRLLSLRYIDDYRWEEIAVEMKYNMRYIYDIHNKALDKIIINFVPYSVAI